jgi:hypothetical protein
MQKMFILYEDYQQDSPTHERNEQEKDWIKQIFLRLVRTGEEKRTPDSVNQKLNC